MSVVGFIQYVLFDAMVIIGRCNNKSGTSFDDGRARRKDKTRLPVPNFPLSHWSSQLFDLRAPSSTDVPVLLLNQPNNRHLKVTQHSFFFFGGGGVPSYFEALWNPHLFFYRKSNNRMDNI